MRPLRVATPLILALAALPAPALAGSWTAPETLRREPGVATPVAAMAPDGRGLVAWWLTGDRTPIFTAAADLRGGFGRPRELAGRRSGVVALSAAQTRRGPVLAWAQKGPEGRRLTMAAQAGPTGTFAAPQQLASGGPSAMETRVLAGLGARTVVAWRKTGLRAAEQPDGGRPFGDGRTIAVPPTSFWDGALSAGGRAALVWNGGSPLTVRARTWSLGGELGPVATLSRRTAREPVVARAGDGFVAAWSEFDRRAYRVRVAFAGADGRFGRARAISEPGEEARQPQVAQDGRGQIVVSWLSSTRRAFGLPPGHVRAATARRPGAAFGRPVDLTPRGERRDNGLRIAAGGGGVHLMWIGRDRVVVAYRPAGGRFERPRTLSAPANQVQAAIAAGAGDRALVAWTARGGRHYPNETVRLQVARR